MKILSSTVPLLLLLNALQACAAHEPDARITYPPTNKFGAKHREHHKLMSRVTSDDSNVDIRVTKAQGERGYNYLRVSAITLDPVGPTGDIAWDYSEPFMYRWKHDWDIGVSGRCDSTPLATLTNVTEQACLRACSDDTPGCKMVSYNDPVHGTDGSALCRGGVCPTVNGTCALYSECAAIVNDDSENGTDTYTLNGRRYLHSKVIEVTPGKPQTVMVGSTPVTLRIPVENGRSVGLIWADPCISGKYIGCHYEESWSMYNKTVTMFNSLATHSDWDYFVLLGDNYYDLDSRLTQSVYNSLSSDFKSKISYTVPGNHDIWMNGGYEGGISDDQFGIGFEQYYAMDTVASLDTSDGSNGFIDLSIDPDAGDGNWTLFTDKNVPENFVWYNKMGDVGYLGFNGASLPRDEMAVFERACRWFKSNKVSSILILGHWNSGDTPNPYLTTPRLHSLLLEMDGCNIGKSLSFFDGHTHCNHPLNDDGTTALPQEGNNFMIGGHGMSSGVCDGSMGFIMVESGGKGYSDGVSVTYFEEVGIDGNGVTVDRFDDLKECVERSGIVACKNEFGEVWK
jgi:hypothetical protein